MAHTAPYGYHYGNEADQYTFYRLPKALFTDARFKTLSDGAKILYGLMLDRMSLSMKNGWLDDQNRVYIFFTLEDIMEQMNCRNDKGVKMLAELDTVKGVGLIERVKQGQGRPTIIYVRKFIDGAEVLTSEKPKSGLPGLPKSRVRKNRSLHFGKTDANKTEYSNPEKNENNQNDSDDLFQSDRIAETCPTPPPKQDRMGMDETEAYRELIKENIEYDILVEAYGHERMDEVVELMTDTICSKRKSITIASSEYSLEVVKSRFLKIDSRHIEYVFGCIDQNTTKVRNIRKYMLATLYNAPATMDSYYRAEVNHDFWGDGY